MRFLPNLTIPCILGASPPLDITRFTGYPSGAYVCFRVPLQCTLPFNKHREVEGAPERSVHRMGKTSAEVETSACIALSVGIMYSPAAQAQRSNGATSRYASPTRSSAVKSGDAHERFQTVQRFTTLVRRAKDIAHSATVSRDVHGYSAFRSSTYQSTPPIAGGNSALRGNTSDFVSLSRDPRDPRLLFAPLREAMNEPLVPRARRPRRAQSVPPSVSAAWTALNDSAHVHTSTRGTSPSMASRYGDPGRPRCRRLFGSRCLPARCCAPSRWAGTCRL
jgi:hypothetical protein